MKDYSIYIFVAVILIALGSVQYNYHQEYNRSTDLDPIFENLRNDKTIITTTYSAKIDEDYACFELNLPYFKNTPIANNSQLIKLVLSNLLEDYALHYSKLTHHENQTNIAILINASRKNFLLNIRVIKQDNGEYLIDNIDGMCEFLEDVKLFLDFGLEYNCI